MAARRKRKPRRTARRMTGIITTILVFGSIAYGGSKLVMPYHHADAHISTWNSTDYVTPQMARHHPITEPTPLRQTILLIGTDARTGDPLGNSDVLCLASIDYLNRRVELLSIPRDTQVALPDGRYHKINDAMAVGGPALTVDTVQKLVDMPIDGYAVTRFDGLVHMIDRMGGVTINVLKNMHYRTGDKTHGLIDLQKGVQHLNGEQALGFVRYRHDALGDIGRTKRQQEFLLAMKNQLLQPKTIPKLPAVVYDAARSMETNLSLIKLGKLVGHARRISDFTTIHETLPGSFHDPRPGRTSDLSYWIVNPIQARYVAHRFFEQGIVQQNPIQDPNVTATWQLPAPPPSPSTTKANTAATP